MMHLRRETVCLCGGSDAESRGTDGGCSLAVIAFVSVVSVSAHRVVLHLPLLFMISSSYMLSYAAHTARSVTIEERRKLSYKRLKAHDDFPDLLVCCINGCLFFS
jgi:hypothetical protein